MALTSPSRPAVRLEGIDFSAMTESEVVQHVMTCLSGRTRPAGRRGGWIVTPNADISRQVRHDPVLRDMIRAADIVVADGMPLVWASAIIGDRLPARVTGASLFESLAAAAAERGHRVMVLGGRPGTSEKAIEVLRARHPGLQGGGWSPPRDLEATACGRAEIAARIQATQAGVVFCGFGFPKQERLICALASEFPDVWFLGCGAAVDFTAGTVSRAPQVVQRTGLEWLYRLAHEPRRLFVRYVIRDLPYVARLLGAALVRRVRSRSAQR